MTERSIEVQINGVIQNIDANTSVSALVERWHPTGRGIAVAIDRSIVPRSRWSETTLQPGAAIEIVSAVAGG